VPTLSILLGEPAVLTDRMTQLLRAEGTDVLTVTGDVFAADTVQRLVDATTDRFGRVTHLVPNVGILHHYGPLLTIERQAFSDTVIGNTWFAIELMQRALDAGMADARGAVCVISAIGAGMTSPVNAAYDAGKTALDSLTRALARELGPRGVRVNIVAPGLIRTPTAEFIIRGDREAAESSILPLRRIGEPEDIADAVAFLLSGESSYITGSTLVVDGGRSLVGSEGPYDLFGKCDVSELQDHFKALEDALSG
jgi:3-oxoacyl-[acyl-carrier protein] reductase